MAAQPLGQQATRTSRLGPGGSVALNRPSSPVTGAATTRSASPRSRTRVARQTRAPRTPSPLPSRTWPTTVARRPRRAQPGAQCGRAAHAGESGRGCPP